SPVRTVASRGARGDRWYIKWYTIFQYFGSGFNRSDMIRTSDGIALHAEETGTGFPVLFLHEFAGDHRSWEPQVRYFSRTCRCVTYSARGYPPSDVPADPAVYSQERAVADAIEVLDGFGIERAHVVGLSMGGFTALHLV